MLNFTLLRLILLRLGRLSRRKWLIFLGTCLIIFLTSFLILDSILLIINQFTNFYHWLDCLSGKMLARQEVCTSYEKGKIAGNLCPDWCSGSTSILQSCPSSKTFHVGKECIFRGQWKESDIIVKAKKLKVNHMIDEDIKLTREETIQGIHAIIATDFEGTEIDPSYLTIPWFGSSVKLSSLTNKELNSLWTLAQDNEYIYSTFFGQLTQWNSVKLLPQVLGTCGHFYAVEYIPEAIHFFDVIPEKSSLHIFKSSFSKRLSISHMLLKFLYHLESGNYNLQLCDVKYDQFAMKNGTIMLIDSDMLYPSEVVQESIQHIDSCIKDEDCDFIDCKGRCKPSKVGGTCDIDIESDSNLKRICRNLFFIDEISSKDLVKSSSQINAGLLSHFPLSYQSDIYKLKQLCSGWIKESEMISTIKKMIDLTSAVQSRTYPLND